MNEHWKSIEQDYSHNKLEFDSLVSYLSNYHLSGHFRMKLVKHPDAKSKDFT